MCLGNHGTVKDRHNDYESFFFFIFLINCAFLKQTNFSHSKIDMQGHALRMNSF